MPQTNSNDRKVTGNLKVEGEIIARLSPEEKKARGEADEIRERREKRKELTERITLGSVILVALLTLWQSINNQRLATTTGKQAKLLRNQIVLDQRPIVKIGQLWFGDESGNRLDEPVLGRPVIVTIPFTNVGKSAAKDFRAFRWVTFGPYAVQLLRTKKAVASDLRSRYDLPRGQRQYYSCQ
jgi:hypothetical protein